MKYAVCALIEKEGKVLAVTRRNKPDDWGLPGGKVEFGETNEAAIRREVKEETGLMITFMSELFEDVAIEDGEEWQTITYHCETKGLPVSLESGIDVAYISFEKLCSDNNTFHQYNRKLYNQMKINFLQSLIDEQNDDRNFTDQNYLAEYEEDLYILDESGPDAI
jgi:hypothetical protein